MQVPSGPHAVLGTPIKPPFPEGLETLVSAWAASGAPSASSGRPPGVYTTAVGYAGGITPNPTYEETCTGHRPHRGRARRLRPDEDLARGDAEGLLGEPRPDAGHAPGQRHRHPVPLGDLLPRPEQRAAAEATRDHTSRRSTRPATARSPPRSPSGRSTTPRTTTSSTSTRSRTATGGGGDPVRLTAGDVDLAAVRMAAGRQRDALGRGKGPGRG